MAKKKQDSDWFSRAMARCATPEPSNEMQKRQEKFLAVAREIIEKARIPGEAGDPFWLAMFLEIFEARQGMKGLSAMSFRTTRDRMKKIHQHASKLARLLLDDLEENPVHLPFALRDRADAGDPLDLARRIHALSLGAQREHAVLCQPVFRKRRRPPEALREAVIRVLMGIYSDLTGREPGKRGPFFRFAGLVLERIGMWTDTEALETAVKNARTSKARKTPGNLLEQILAFQFL